MQYTFTLKFSNTVSLHLTLFSIKCYFFHLTSYSLLSWGIECFLNRLSIKMFLHLYIKGGYNGLDFRLTNSVCCVCGYFYSFNTELREVLEQRTVQESVSTYGPPHRGTSDI